MGRKDLGRLMPEIQAGKQDAFFYVFRAGCSFITDIENFCL